MSYDNDWPYGVRSAIRVLIRGCEYYSKYAAGCSIVFSPELCVALDTLCGFITELKGLNAAGPK